MFRTAIFITNEQLRKPSFAVKSKTPNKNTGI